LEEVIVKARKRAAGESVQDVPVAVTAFSSDQFKAVFAEDMVDLGMLTPNVHPTPGSQVGSQAFSIRGLGVAGTVPSDAPAVGLFQNGVYWGMNYGALIDAFDVESVEILRGPQGTLFGRNVTGGAILVNTKRPSDDFGYELEGVYGSHGRLDLSAAIEGPLSDRLLGRLSVLSRMHDGYYDNVLQGGKDAGEDNVAAIRGTLVYDILDNIDLTLIADRYDQNSGQVLVRQVDKPGSLPYEEGHRAPSDPFDVAHNDPGWADIEVDSVTLEVNWDLGHGMVTSITGYRDLEVNQFGDFDASPSQGLNLSVDVEQDQLSQELRYASSNSSFFNYTLGLYYFEQDWDYREGRAINNNALVFASGNTMNESSYSAFGEADLQLSEEWILTFGGRFNKEEKKVRTVPFGGCPLDENVPNPQRIQSLRSIACDLGPMGTESWSDFSPKIALRWEPNENLMTYVSWSTGFRSGGFAARGNSLLPPFDAEEVTAIEVGLKGMMLDDRVRLNVALYQNDYADLQRTILTPGTEIAFTQSTQNAGEATISGAEVEVSYQATQNLIFTASWGLTDAKFDEFVGFDLDGDGSPDPDEARQLKFSQVPENTYNASVNYSKKFADKGYVDFRLALRRIDDLFHDDQNLVYEPGHNIVDANISFQPFSENWTISLFGKNLSNEDYAFEGADLGGLGANRFLFPPRTWGVRWSYDY
tara:strand:- start:7955 stop:10057 length:2103 start_codon:yes stop_codon:yes gene_type:complete